jgi:SAM-dependent methyltransferase
MTISSKSFDASDYYKKNSQLHGGETPISSVIQTNKIPPIPTEMDHVIYWIMNRKSTPDSILDIGCAQLTLSRSLSGFINHQVGVDIAPYPNWKANPEISKSVVDLDKSDLPFVTASFDIVSMLMVLEHVFNPFHAVRELRRVCKPEGIVIISVPNLASIRHRLRLLFGLFPITSARFSFDEDAWDGYHIHNFTRASLEWLLLKEGLKPVAWQSQGRFQWLKRISPALFGADLIAFCEPSNPQPGLPFPL